MSTKQSGPLARQTRASFDTGAVLEFLKGCPWKGEPPQQGWLSLVEEACHRIAQLETDLHATEILFQAALDAGQRRGQEDRS